MLQHMLLDPTGVDRRSAFAQSRALVADATATAAQHSPFGQAAAGGGAPQGGWAPMAVGGGSGGLSSAGLSSGYSSAAHSRSSSWQSRAGSRELGAALAAGARVAAARAGAAPPAQQHPRQRDSIASRSMDFSRQHSQVAARNRHPATATTDCNGRAAMLQASHCITTNPESHLS